MYEPKPIDTSRVSLSDGLHALIEKLAAHNHDLWAKGRITEGWTLGPKRDDDKKEHPGLVPYDELPESEKQYDRNMAIGTLKAIIALGYCVEPR